MKKEIEFGWYGDGPESSNPGETVIITIDFADLLYDEDDKEDQESLEEATRAFAKDLQSRFGADYAQTDTQIAEEDKYWEGEAKKIGIEDVGLI